MLLYWHARLYPLCIGQHGLRLRILALDQAMALLHSHCGVAASSECWSPASAAAAGWNRKVGLVHSIQ